MTRDAKGFLTFNVKIFTLLQGYVKFQAKILTGSPVSILGRNPLASLSQGSKSRKISYRAFVHDFVRCQNIFRARKKSC